jgi:hypothetical protein
LAILGVLLGLFMATDERSRGLGLLFALWWVPGVAAAVGVLLRDPVALVVGLLCFVLAGAAIASERGAASEAGKPRAVRTDRRVVRKPGSKAAGSFGKRGKPVSERARAREERAKGHRRAAS